MTRAYLNSCKINKTASVFRPPPNMNWILSLPNVLVPKSLQLAIYCGKFFEWMSYSDWNLAFNQCEGNNGRIFENLILGNIHFTLNNFSLYSSYQLSKFRAIDTCSLKIT